MFSSLMTGTAKGLNFDFLSKESPMKKDNNNQNPAEKTPEFNKFS